MIRKRIAKFRNIVDGANVRVTYKPNPVAVYLKNVRRGLIGSIRAALRQCLPSWAVLGFRIVGGSVLEIITDGRIKDLLITTLKVLGVKRTAQI